MRTWLEERGHTSLFLDFDRETGIRAGSDWEQTLYAKLRQCQAVIAVLTPSWLASKWCFAELVQAREKGKKILPVKVSPCDTSDLFRDLQHIDLTVDPADGYDRLALSLQDVFGFDPARRPYPGLQAFQEEDAAIYFGRGKEIAGGLESLSSLRLGGRGAPRLLLMLGASGSGKSSLVRAGLIPRLRRMPSEWLPLTPFRPQENPLRELALSLVEGFQDVGRSRPWDEVDRLLQRAAGKTPPDGRILLDLARELAFAAGRREATVALTVDQAEELFGYTPAEDAGRFLRLLRAALEASDRQLMGIATLRSDALGEFQTHQVLSDPTYDHDFLYKVMPVDPIPERNFAEIIRGPAGLVGLGLEEELVEAMVSDTGDRDALPLLAFTLRLLHDRYAEDGVLKVADYDRLGRLEGAIRAEADRVLKEAEPSSRDLEDLRAAFVPTMVRLNAEGGYARRRAHAAAMPPRARPLLRRFVDARLLVSDVDPEGRETLEVAHEALLRAWPLLTGWLVEDQAELRQLAVLHQAAEEWGQAGRTADLLVHRDGRLRDAQSLVSRPRFVLREGAIEREYLDACADAQKARDDAQEEERDRRLRDAQRIAEEQRKAARRTLVGLAVALLLLIWVWFIARVAKERLAATVARKLAADTQLGAASDFDRSLLMAAQAHAIRPFPEVTRSWADLLFRDSAPAAIARSPEAAREALVGMSPGAPIIEIVDGFTLDDVYELETPVLWQTIADAAELYCSNLVEVNAMTGQGSYDPVDAGCDQVELRLVDACDDVIKAGVPHLASAGRGWAALVSESGEVEMLRQGSTAACRAETLAEGQEDVEVLAVAIDGGMAAWRRRNRTEIEVSLLQESESRRLTLTGAASSAVDEIRFAADRSRIATLHQDGAVTLWDLSKRGELTWPLALPGREFNAVEFGKTEDSTLLLIGGAEGIGQAVWTDPSGGELKPGNVAVWRPSFDWPGHLALTADRSTLLWVEGNALYSASTEVAATGDMASTRLFELPHGSAGVFAVDSGFTRVAAVGNEGLLIVVRDRTGEEVARREVSRFNVQALMFHPDDQARLAVGTSGGAWLWCPDSAEETEILAGGDVHGLAWDSRGERLALAVDQRVALWQPDAKVERRDFESVGAIVNAVAFSPDGKRIAAADGRGRVSVWDIESGRPVLSPIQRHRDAATDLAFHPEGRWLVSVGRAGDVVAWDLDPDSWRAASCRVAGRDLAPEEWRAAVGEEFPYVPQCGSP
ncbi:MAG TPA: TIR domain-containing protein [Thermoanaerobaculia bacterium]